MFQRRWFLRLITLPPRLIYRLGLGRLIDSRVLLLITTGRKTGHLRTTLLQYDIIDGVIYVGSMRGQRADWFRNLVAKPQVEVRLKQRRFAAHAEPITDPARIADFLEMRLRKHPRMVATMLRADSVSAPPSRADLERYAARLAMVALHPAVPI